MATLLLRLLSRSRLLAGCAAFLIALPALSAFGQSTTVKFTAPGGFGGRYVIVQFSYPDWSPYGDPITSGFGTTVYLTNGQSYSVVKNMRYSGPNLSVVASWREDYSGSPANPSGSSTPTPGGTLEFYTGAAPPPQYWIKVDLLNFTQCTQTNWVVRSSDDETLGGWEVPALTKTPHTVTLGPFSERFNWYLYASGACSTDAQLNYGTNGFVTSVGSSSASTSSTMPNLPQITPNTPDTTNITFSTNGTAGARDQTLQEGFSTLRSVTQQMADREHQDLVGIGGKLDVIANKPGGQTNAITKAEMQSLTNGLSSPDSASQKAQGEAASDTVKGQFNSVADEQMGRTFTMPGSTGSKVIELSAGHLGSWSVDISPLTNASLGFLAAIIRTIMLWALCYWMISNCLQVVEEYLRAATSARQATTAGTAAFGTNLNTPIAIGMAGVITVALAAIPAAALTITSSLSAAGVGVWSVYGTNPFAGIGGDVGTGLGWLCAMIPLPEAMAMAVVSIGFRFSVGGIYWVATTVVRFFVG